MKNSFKKLFVSFLVLFSTFLSAQIVSESTLWEAKLINDVYLVKIKSDADLKLALNDFVKSKEIHYAIIQGAGDLNHAVLVNESKSKRKKFKSSTQLTDLNGNLTLVDGVKKWDLKATLSNKSLKAYTGNIDNAIVNERVEVYIYPLTHKVHKSTDLITGIASFDFTK